MTRFSLLCAAVALLGACSDSKETTAPAPQPVASVVVTALPDTIRPGDVVQLSATLRDAAGQPLSDRAITWTSSDTLVAAVSIEGRVTGVGQGSVTITATSEGRTATASSYGLLTRAPNRFAYATITQFQGTYTTSRITNATGGNITVASDASGNAIVTFERMGRADPAWRETVMVSHLSGPMRCHINSWETAENRRDLKASVGCYNTNGSRSLNSFSILAFGNGALEGRHGFVESTDAAASHAADATKSFNSSGNAMSITRSAAGNYRVTVNNDRANGKTENYFVSTFGPANATCILGGWSYGGSSDAICNTLGGVGTDTRFAMQLIESGRAGKRWAYAWNSGAHNAVDVEFTPSTQYQAMSSGAQVKITPVLVSSYVGHYDVRFPGFGALAAGTYNVQISPYTSNTATCVAGAGTAINGGADMQVRVTCFGRYDGSPTNTSFTILVIE